VSTFGGKCCPISDAGVDRIAIRTLLIEHNACCQRLRDGSSGPYPRMYFGSVLVKLRTVRCSSGPYPRSCSGPSHPDPIRGAAADRAIRSDPNPIRGSPRSEAAPKSIRPDHTIRPRYPLDIRTSGQVRGSSSDGMVKTTMFVAAINIRGFCVRFVRL